MRDFNFLDATVFNPNVTFNGSNFLPITLLVDSHSETFHLDSGTYQIAGQEVSIDYAGLYCFVGDDIVPFGGYNSEWMEVNYATRLDDFQADWEVNKAIYYLRDIVDFLTLAEREEFQRRLLLVA